jgi:hypothetical protein
VLFHYAANRNTPFIVAETTFLDLRNKTEDELKPMLEHLQKQFIVEFLSCFYSGLEVVPLTYTGFSMLSFDQGNPTLKLDDPGQTWLLSACQNIIQ